MKTKKKISIVIPAWNEEQYIEDTIKSILAQDYKNFEIIIVCNGCRDKTRDIARKYTSKVLNLLEGNVSRARNEGVFIANADKLVFLDADTIMGQGVLKKINEQLEKGNFYGTLRGLPSDKNIATLIYTSLKHLINPFIFWNNGVIYCRKKDFLAVNGFNNNLKKKGELRDFRKRIKDVARYHYIKDSYVIPSQRRLEKWGLSKLTMFWVKEHTNMKNGRYNAVR